jgi:hypothetical protein
VGRRVDAMNYTGGPLGWLVWLMLRAYEKLRGR